MWKYSIEISGMMCSMCEAHINDAIRKAFPVKKVKSSHAKGQCIIVTEQELEENKLNQIISSLGYTLGTIKKEPYEKHSLFGRR